IHINLFAESRDPSNEVIVFGATTMPCRPRCVATLLEYTHLFEDEQNWLAALLQLERQLAIMSDRAIVAGGLFSCQPFSEPHLRSFVLCNNSGLPNVQKLLNSLKFHFGAVGQDHASTL